MILTTHLKQQNNKTLKTSMFESLEKSKENMNNNKLALNKPKTKFVAITDKINVEDSLSIPDDNSNEPVTNNRVINILCIHINSKLKMNDHIAIGNKSLINKLTSRISALKKLVKISDFKFWLNLANGLFISKQVYGIKI